MRLVRWANRNADPSRYPTRLRRTARRVTMLYDKWIRSAGLSVAQFMLLVILSFKDGCSIGTLAARADVDPTTLNRNLKPLSKRKLVRIGQSPKDRRVRAVFITEAGWAKIREALPLATGAR
jgi:DNA-binding MarR family transcriptional regulator